MPAAPSKEFLTRKAGPLPVWGWGLAGLGAAYAYSRYAANKASSSSSGSSGTTATAAEPTETSPYYVIENNLPDYTGTSTTTTPVTVSPPGTGSSPPVLQGGNPPIKPGGGVAAPTHTATITPGTVLQIPVAVNGSKTIASIAKEFGISTQHLLNNNPGISSNASNVAVNVPYLVKSGDTAASIASRFQISTAHLQQALANQPGSS